MLQLSRKIGETLMIGEAHVLELLDVRDRLAEFVVREPGEDPTAYRLPEGAEVPLWKGVKIVVRDVGPRRVMFAIDAPRGVPIHRSETLEKPDFDPTPYVHDSYVPGRGAPAKQYTGVNR